MGDKPQVSVIIPAYNAERYIIEAVQSVLAQTCGNLEAVVINDGSTDGTADYVESFRNDHVFQIHQENSGLAMARNRGIEAASGEFIAFLDADDIWRQDKLAKQLPLFEDPNVGCVYSRSLQVNENGIAINRERQQLYRGKILMPLITDNFITVSSVILRASLLDTNKILFRAGRSGVEDWDLWLRLAQFTLFDYVDEPVVHYRVHSGGMSQNKDIMYRGHMVTLNDLEKSIRVDPQYRDVERTVLLGLYNQKRPLEILRYGHWLLAQNRIREAKDMMFRAFKSNKKNLHTWWGLVKAHLYGIKAFLW